jgi:hypothetical protein
MHFQATRIGTVTFFIQTFFIRDKVYTNFLYTGQSLYGTKFIRDKVYTGTKFIRGQSLYGDKVYTGRSSYGDKVYTWTKFIQTFCMLYTIKSYILLLVKYHMDTLSGIGYRSEHIHGGHPCTLYTGGYVYGERWIHYLG